MPESDLPAWLAGIAWIGVAIVALTLAYWVQGVKRVRLSPNVAPVRIAFTGGALLCATPFVAGGGGVFLQVLCGIAIAVAVLFMGLDRIAALPSPVPNAVIGEVVPDFTTLDSEGESFTLSSLRGRPVLLKFFRGHW